MPRRVVPQVVFELLEPPDPLPHRFVLKLDEVIHLRRGEAGFGSFEQEPKNLGMYFIRDSVIDDAKVPSPRLFLQPA